MKYYALIWNAMHWYEIACIDKWDSMNSKLEEHFGLMQMRWISGETNQSQVRPINLRWDESLFCSSLNYYYRKNNSNFEQNHRQQPRTMACQQQTTQFTSCFNRVIEQHTFTLSLSRVQVKNNHVCRCLSEVLLEIIMSWLQIDAGRRYDKVWLAMHQFIENH